MGLCHFWHQMKTRLEEANCRRSNGGSNHIYERKWQLNVKQFFYSSNTFCFNKERSTNEKEVCASFTKWTELSSKPQASSDFFLGLLAMAEQMNL